MNEITVSLPKLPTQRLDDLRVGDAFMLVRERYGEIVSVYVVIKNTHTSVVEAINLQYGEIKVFGSNTRVVQLKMTMTCEVYDPNSDLPF